MHKMNFEDLFIYDMANNHQGDLKHGLDIIKSMGKVTRDRGVRAGLKFQFRQIDTFIHPDYKNNEDLPHISRFVSTVLTKDDYRVLIEEVRKQGMITICTPFDEESVAMILELDIEIIKVASCSATDKPLLKSIVGVNRPVIVSTAGLSLDQFDRLVSFLKHNNVNFALMHCVAIYPTPVEMLNLNHIEQVRQRYPDITVGFSTHESPDNYSAIQIAYAKGARLFERHVGIENTMNKLNAYSSNPEQVGRWLDAHQEAVKQCGGEEYAPAYPDEISSLRSLKRGVFAYKDIKKGKTIYLNDVSFSMPLLDGHLSADEWTDGFIADKHYQANEPLCEKLANHEVFEKEQIYGIVLQVIGMLNNARIFVNKDSTIELSHHYGLKRFREFGAVLINCINRAYCKKLVIQLPRQKHPYHYHKQKEETFQLLYGDLEVVLEGHKSKLEPGGLFLVKPNQWHKFHTLDGAIIEEVSTTHYNDDSFYEDVRIDRIPREKRKTQIVNWKDAIEMVIDSLPEDNAQKG